MAAQTRETLAKIGRTLAEAGASPADVVEGLVYLTDAAVVRHHERRISRLLRRGFPGARHRGDAARRRRWAGRDHGDGGRVPDRRAGGLPEPDDRPRIGISACLLGDQVRFDGGHKRDRFLTDVLAPHVQCVRVCPEVEVGMGTPRETLRLVRAGRRAVRMVTTRTGIDHTDAMVAWSRQRAWPSSSAEISPATC